MNDQSRRTEPKDPRVEAALREYLERVDRGEPLDREEFLARHAPIAEQLRSFIAAEEDVRKLAAGGAGAETPQDRTRDSTKSFVGQGQETLVPQLMAKRNVVRGLEGRFGRYRIIRALGKGAMGTVYLAEDTQIERQVALKTPHFTEDPTGEQLERFFREARAAGNLRHQHICPIHDFGQIDGRHFITMAYIEGRPLSAFIQPDSQQAERQILLLVRKLALALQEAHDNGVVHRDLKPANIMVDKKGEPIIMDFGLAQQTRRNEDVRLTQTGNILGTPAFMSPEQVEGEPEKIGPPADQYGLGVILYELLTGELPFRGSIAAVMGQILTKEPPPPRQRRPDLDARIEAVCLKMMAKNPAERFRSLKAVADEISSNSEEPGREDHFQGAAGTLSRSVARRRSHAGGRRRVPGSEIAQAEGAVRKGPGVTRGTGPQMLLAPRLRAGDPDHRAHSGKASQRRLTDAAGKVPRQSRRNLVPDLRHRRGRASERSPEIAQESRRVIEDQAGPPSSARDPGEVRRIRRSGAARIGLVKQFTQPWNEGGWIPWSALAFGLGVFAVVYGVIVIFLGKATIMIDAKDPGITVEVKDRQVTINVPGEQSIKVEPGEEVVKVSYAGLEAVTKRFTLDRGKTRRLTVRVLDNKLVADLEGEIAPPAPAHEEKVATAAEPTLKSTATLPPTLNSAATLSPTFKNSLGMEFVLVPKGKSWLGGGGGRPGNTEVVIAHDFYLGKYEVTQEEWQKLTGVNASHFSRTGGAKEMVKDIADAELRRFPVETVLWDDAQAFLERLNNREQGAGWVYRLPKVEEWEYACRGGPLSNRFDSADHFYLDKPTNQLLPEQANFGHHEGLKRTCKVGSYKPNRLGLCDMHGNVWEWCDNAEQTTDGAAGRAVRGGSWRLGADLCRAAHRHALARSFQGGIVGFRVARVPVGKEVVAIPTEEKKRPEAVPSPPADGPKPNVATTSPSFFGRPFFVRGQWAIENDELVQPTLAMGDERPLVVFGEETLSNYDLSLEAKKTDGDQAVGVYFHWLGPGQNREFCRGGNLGIDFSYHHNGKWGREAGNWKRLNFASNRWYSLKVEVRGAAFRAYLDGVLQFEQTDARFTHGRICLFTNNAAARFRRIKVSAPQGKVLFEGLPELPPLVDARPAEDVDKAARQALPSAAPKTADAQNGFVPLFNGKDLTGWKTHPSQPGNWRVEDGVLIGSGADRSHLYSARDDFKDFHLRVVARVNDGGKTGVYFRAPFGPNMPLKLKQPLSPSNKAAWLTGYNAKIDADRFGGLLIGADSRIETHP